MLALAESDSGTDEIAELGSPTWLTTQPSKKEAEFRGSESVLNVLHKASETTFTLDLLLLSYVLTGREVGSTLGENRSHVTAKVGQVLPLFWCRFAYTCRESVKPGRGA
jgi:hypothetical protein